MADARQAGADPRGRIDGRQARRVDGGKAGERGIVEHGGIDVLDIGGKIADGAGGIDETGALGALLAKTQEFQDVSQL